MKNSKTKKILSILLAVMMVVGMIPATAIPAYAAVIEGATGTGATKDDPLIVDTYDELYAALTSGYNNLYIEVNGNIVCDRSYYDANNNITCAFPITSSVTLTINGTINSGANMDTFALLSPNITVTIKGNGSIISKRKCIVSSKMYSGDNRTLTIDGNLTFEGVDNLGIIENNGYVLTVLGGTFKNSAGSIPFYLSEVTSNCFVFIKSASFPTGLRASDTESAKVILVQHGSVIAYADGTYSSKILEKDGAVEIKPLDYSCFGFSTQTPKMPSGQTKTHLGDFVIGDKNAEITFGFAPNTLDDMFVALGYSVQEELMVCGENGILLKQSSGKNFTIDNRIARDYTIYETIRLIDKYGDVEKELTHTFTLSIISEENYGKDFPLGSKYNPYVVSTTTELSNALSNAGASETFIKFADDIAPPNDYLSITSDVTIDLNGFGFKFPLDLLDNKPSYDIEVKNGATLTLCGSGTLYFKFLTLSDSTLVIKDNVKLEHRIESSVATQHFLCKNGSLVMYGGEFITNDYFFSANYNNSLIMYGGELKLGRSFNSSNNVSETNQNFEFYGGKIALTGSGSGITANVNGDATANNVLATDGAGEFTVIDDFGEFRSYGKDRMNVSFAAPEFIEQSPKMPEGETTTDLGDWIDDSYPIYFNAVPLEKEFIDAGYSMVESLQIYNDEGKRVYSTSNNASNGKGIYYDLNNLPDDNYTIIEGVALKDQKGKTVLENTNTFEIKWKQQIIIDEVNIEVANPDDQTAHIRGELQTKGVNFDLAKWFLVNTDGTLTENGSKIFVPGNTYRYVVDLGLDEHYVFANGYTVKINGEDASRNDDGTWYKDFVARKKLKPIVEQDTYFFQSGTTREIRVDAHGDGVTYGWTGVSAGAGGYYTVSDYTDRILKLEIPEGAEGTNKYLVRFKDEYGDTAERMITVHITSLGFKEIKPTPTAEEFEAGVTDYGYVFPGADGSGVPKVYFEAYELSQVYIDEGYTMETSLIDYVDGVKVGEGYEAWEYTT
ncbi:MAG: hypothetical protein UH854_03460, partial [Clostridia bacterium]|nr:hypothetical protein [Clostridia bacterium]